MDPAQKLKLLDSPFESYDGRRESSKTLLGFSLVYLTGYFTDPPAEFHPELFRCLENPAEKRLVIVGFRGSGKSTDGSFALPLFAALEYPQQYPFIILISDSTRQATLNISAIKNELETNALIKQDYGEIRGNVIEDFSLKGDGEEWQKQNIVLSNGVRILARSRGQKVRGLRHLQHRPKLVIVDDPEDGEWVRTKENRDKTERWLRSEVIGGIDARKGRLIVIGNLLHADALVPRLSVKDSGFKVLNFPLIRDGVGDRITRCTWPAMYPTEKALADKERDMGPVAWSREMLLTIIADDEAIIKPEDIHYYDERPKSRAERKAHGVDLAISQKEGADYTAIVSGEVFYVDDTPKIFIRPHPYNEHVTFHEFFKHVRAIPAELGGVNEFFVEDVQYQKAAIQEMERAMLPVTAMKPVTDKRSRLQVVAPYIKNGTVLFPRAGCEELLGQLFNLGVESHDDQCLDGDTVVITDRGEVHLRDILAGDFVMTRQGYKRVLWAGQTGYSEVITRFGLTGTSNHPVITTLGIRRLDSLEPSDMVYSWQYPTIQVCRVSNAGAAGKPLFAIPDLIAQRITAFAHVTVQRWRMSKTLETATKDINSPKHSALNWLNESGSPIGADGITSLSDMSRWIGRTLRHMFFTTTECIIAILNQSVGLIASITGITEAHELNRSRFTGSYGSTTMAQSTASSTFITRTAIPLTTDFQISQRRTNESICPSTCASPSELLCLAKQSRQRKRQRQCGIDHQKEESGTVSTLNGSSSENAKQPVYNLLVEDAHEFFANGILVHNCDALVWLLQGLANSGLDLPKIHWIEA